MLPKLVSSPYHFSSPSDPTKLVLTQEEEVGVEKISQDLLEVNTGEVEHSVGEVEDSVGEVEDTGGEVKSVFTAKDFRSLQDKTENIRNMSVHGHTYHGKTRVTSCLLEKVLYSLF